MKFHLSWRFGRHHHYHHHHQARTYSYTPSKQGKKLDIYVIFGWVFGWNFHLPAHSIAVLIVSFRKLEINIGDCIIMDTAFIFHRPLTLLSSMPHYYFYTGNDQKWNNVILIDFDWLFKFQGQTSRIKIIYILIMYI